MEKQHDTPSAVQPRPERDLDATALRKLVENSGKTVDQVAQTLALCRQLADGAIPDDVLERDSKKKSL